MNKTRRIDSTLPRPTVAQRRALCSHMNVIGLADGTEVCVNCEAVISDALAVHVRQEARRHGF